MIQKFKNSKIQSSYHLIISSSNSFLLFSFLLFSFFLFSTCHRPVQAPKYIFYFIGDGFGVGALTYCENMAKENGDTLCFSRFPVTGLVTTRSASGLVTCSSAAATALACGEKTNNFMLGVTPDSVRVLTPISKILHEKGFLVGIATSVSIDHATPAGFYAHSTNRKSYYDIAKQLPVSGFEFFAGSGFVEPEPDDSVSIFTLLKNHNYAVSTSIAQCSNSKSLRNILIQPPQKNAIQLPYSIYKEQDDFTLAQITQVGIGKLSAHKKPFFFMIEGGLIDWASHDSLAKELRGEVQEFSEAVKVALKFYRQHPKETLIIVTADHETGGVFVAPDRLHFTTDEHTGNIVPIFAIGAGSERFSGLYDNTEIMRRILQVVGERNFLPSDIP